MAARCSTHHHLEQGEAGAPPGPVGRTGRGAQAVRPPQPDQQEPRTDSSDTAAFGDECPKQLGKHQRYGRRITHPNRTDETGFVHGANCRNEGRLRIPCSVSKSRVMEQMKRSLAISPPKARVHLRRHGSTSVHPEWPTLGITTSHKDLHKWTVYCLLHHNGGRIERTIPPPPPLLPI